MQSIPSVDLYRELEVDPAATAETIDAAWKSLLKRHHPDVASDPAATLERVKRINLAHEWLSDPRLRELYDRTRRRPTVIAGPGPGPRRGPGARTRTPTPSPVSAGTASAAASAATAPPETSSGETRGSTAAAAQSAVGPAPTGDAPDALDAAAAPDSAPDPAVGPNPYREFNRPRPALAQTPRRWQIPSRVPSYLLPVGLVSVLILVALSSYIASQRVAPGPSNAAVQGATRAPSHIAAPVASTVAGSGAIDPRSLPSPDIRADLPAGCAGTTTGNPFAFSKDVGRSIGQVVVARCDEQRSFGPLVYLAGPEGWTLTAKGTFEDGYAYQAFTGRISGKAADEFGIAWTSGDGTTSHIVLYRVNHGLEVFWNSADTRLAWDLAEYDYQPFVDPAAGGYLVITSADLTTGTCVRCHDHTLYREFYLWSASASGSSGLVRSSRQPFGVGP